MTATANSLFSTRSLQIEEVINNNVEVILPGLDPFWRDTFATSQGVASADQIGRDMVVIKVFQTGMTGVIENNAPAGDWALFGDAGNQLLGPRLHTQGLVNSFPDPTGGANQSPYRLGIPMRAMLANIMFTLGELTAEATPAFIGQVIAPKLEGFSRNIGHQLSTSVYTSQNLGYRLSGIKTGTISTVDLTDGVFSWSFEPDNEACDRYYTGQRVDIYEGVAGDARRNEIETSDLRAPVFVSAVDELTNTVWLVSRYDPDAGTAGGAGDFEAGIADTNYLVAANQGEADQGGAAASPTFTGIAGLNSFLKDGSDGTLIGTPGAGTGDELLLLGSESTGDDISVAVHPEHKTLGYDMQGAVLTEHILRQLCRRFHASKNKYGYYIDCLLASEGLWLSFEGTRIARETISRDGRLGGATPIGYASDENLGGQKITMDGRTYMSYTSTYVDDGVLYGIRKGGNNWKRYVPPSIRNTKPFDRNAPFIPFQFVAGALTGLGTNQLPIYETGASQLAGGGGTLSVNRVTEGSQMPGWMRMQIGCDQACGMIIKNCATSKLYSDF